MLPVAQLERDIWGIGEGPQVEEALYAYATKSPSPDTIFEVNDWNTALKAYHSVNIDDQFVPPIIRIDGDNKPVGLVKDDDWLLYFDFRTDRAKPLTSCFLNIPFGGQVGGLSDHVKANIPNINICTMTHYDDSFNASDKLHEAFNPALPLSDTYGEFAGKQGIQQLVVAESEKWRAVTWFKDGRRNLGYEHKSQDGILITDLHPTLPITVKILESRKVAAHIQAPEMRAKEITDVLLQGVADEVEDIFCNYANSDMVGHAMTNPAWFEGVVDAIIELDDQLSRLIPVALKAGYTIMITGDHGNAEQMIHPNGKANPAHTVNKVPFVILGLGPKETATIREDATIGDMAPTSLHLRGIDKPASWDRNSLLNGNIIPNRHRKIMKLILDGYGINENEVGNAMIAAAKRKGSPLLMDLWQHGTDGAIAGPAEASGERCGYPAGEAGTTEFGHVIFDAGRTVRSDLMLINHALEVGDFFTNPAFIKMIEAVKGSKSRLHLMGITSDGGVHSSLGHIEAIVDMFAKNNVPSDRVSFHIITDGRDVQGDSSPKYVKWLEGVLNKFKIGRIDSIWGRGWGKDRDNRWKRIEAAFRSLVEGTGAMHLRFK